MADEEAGAGPSTSAPSASPRSGVKLFLGGLSWETTEDKLRSHFERYGEIEEVIVMRDVVTKKPRGFGFIIFRDASVAEAVCGEQHELDGRMIDAKRSVPQEQKPRCKKIFVGGLAPDTHEEQFKQHFEQYGGIAEAQIMQDHMSGRSRGFGFVTFEDEASVEKVFAAGTMHDLAGKKVEVKPATPRGSGPVARGAAQPGFVPGRGVFPPRGAAGFAEGELDASQAGYAVAYPGMARYGPPGMVPGFGMGFPPFPYGPNMMVGPYGYGFPGQFPGYQVPPSYDPRQAAAFQYQMAQQAAQAQAQQQAQAQAQQAGRGYQPPSPRLAPRQHLQQQPQQQLQPQPQPQLQPQQKQHFQQQQQQQQHLQRQQQQRPQQQQQQQEQQQQRPGR